jgi:predicted DsbA family dithiol-disulfide isomerase
LASKINIRWRSFQLDPSFPEGKILSSFEHLHIAKGYTVKQIEQMSLPLVEQGNKYGILFDFKKSLNFNTYKLHQLLHWAAIHKKKEALMDAFFEAIFCRGIDLTLEKNIGAICTALHLDSAAAKKVLKQQPYASLIAHDIQEATLLGIHGVPYFAHNKKLLLYGAADEKVLIQLLQQIDQISASEPINKPIVNPLKT